MADQQGTAAQWPQEPLSTAAQAVVEQFAGNRVKRPAGQAPQLLERLLDCRGRLLVAWSKLERAGISIRGPRAGGGGSPPDLEETIRPDVFLSALEQLASDLETIASAIGGEAEDLAARF